MLGNEGMIQRRQSVHSAGYHDTGGMIRRHRYFQFDVNDTQVISGQFSTIAGETISVDWGDGSARSTYSGADQAWSHDYGSAGDRTVRIFGSVVLTKFTMDAAGADISFDIGTLPAGLICFYCYGANTCHGDIGTLPAGLIVFICCGSNTCHGDIGAAPAGLTYFNCCGSNTCHGDIGAAPVGLTHFYCYGANTCHGDIGAAPAGLTVFICYGSNTCHGDIGAAPVGLTYFVCCGSNTIADYSGKTWTTKPVTFILVPVGVGGLSTAEIDQLLIDFDDDLLWSGGNVITLTGTNAARSAASDAAVASIAGEGATVTTN